MACKLKFMLTLMLVLNILIYKYMCTKKIILKNDRKIIKKKTTPKKTIKKTITPKKTITKTITPKRTVTKTVTPKKQKIVEVIKLKKPLI